MDIIKREPHRCISNIKRVAGCPVRQCSVYTYALSGLCCYHTRYYKHRETEEKMVNGRPVRVDFQNRSIESDLILDHGLILYSEM
jgi:hypothetical protein